MFDVCYVDIEYFGGFNGGVYVSISFKIVKFVLFINLGYNWSDLFENWFGSGIYCFFVDFDYVIWYLVYVVGVDVMKVSCDEILGDD